VAARSDSKDKRMAITRRSFLAFAAAASAVEPASAGDEGISPELRALILAHETAYAAFDRIFHRKDNSSRDCERADQIEQKALLAVCSYPAINQGNRRAKAEYLLTVEARGELDLEEHMQAILHSMLRG
jgi:hypothetical protein